MAIFAVGDIHGCLTALQTVLAGANIGADDTLVYLGDYVDRGPDSHGVVELVLEQLANYADSQNSNKSTAPAIITLRGNHEVMMLNARNDLERFFMWQNFGGEETLESYQALESHEWQQSIPQSHWDFLQATEKYFETDTHLYVHAGLRAKTSLEEQIDRDLYWKKYYKPRRYNKDKAVVCGHTTYVDGNIADFEHTIQIDTYAYGGQWLTCLNAQSGEYWQANQEGELRSGKLER